jgi:hypothetical protein
MWYMAYTMGRKVEKLKYKEIYKPSGIAGEMRDNSRWLMALPASCDINPSRALP